MLFSSEVWCITKTELLFLERVHRKILRTSQGLPIRCPSLALNFMMGSLHITSLISQRKLSFIYSIINLPDNSIARMIVCARLAAGVSSSSVIYSWQTILQENSLPTISSLLVEAPCKPLTWKRSVKLILRTKLYNNFLEKCNSLPVVECDMECFLAGHCPNHWSASKGNRAMTRSTNFSVRLLVGCHGLESDACRFRYRKRDVDQPGDPSCKLCNSEAESVRHFIAHCPALSPRREQLLSVAPPNIPDLATAPEVFCDCLLGIVSLHDADVQLYAANFLKSFVNIVIIFHWNHRSVLLLPSTIDSLHTVKFLHL